MVKTSLPSSIDQSLSGCVSLTFWSRTLPYKFYVNYCKLSFCDVTLVVFCYFLLYIYIYILSDYVKNEDLFIIQIFIVVSFVLCCNHIEYSFSRVILFFL